jgi:AcrR family transcriptional regulator
LASSADITKARLIGAAERLFAERGIDAVSLREINRASGARNAIAVQYHFEDRAGVVKAILAKHTPDVEARRHAMLDQYEADGPSEGPAADAATATATDVRRLAGALVRPLAAKLSDPDGGPEYLQIHADLLNRPHPRMAPAGAGPDTADPNDSVDRWRMLVQPLLEESAVRLHRRLTAIQFTAVELGRRARSGPHTDERLFTSYVIDVVAAILQAPVSAETRRLAAERDAARQGEAVR